MKRKLVTVGAAALMALTLTACSPGTNPGSTTTPASGGDTTTASGQYTIGLAVANLQAEFFNMVKESVEAKAKELGINITTVDAGGDANTQVTQIEDLITKKVDAIIYIPAGADAATVPVRDAHAAGIPVVTVDRNPTGEPGDTFIATDSVASAKALGQWVVQQTGGTGNLGIIQGQLGTTPEEDRDKGFTEGIAGSSIKEVWRQASDQWHQDEGFAIAQDEFQAHPDTNIIFGRADALALGAAQAVRAAGLSNVLIVGFDGDVAGLQAVKNGTIAATMCQQSFLMGGMAVTSAIDLIQGKSLPVTQLQTATLVTPDNVDQYLAQHP